jgi:hypothetical protein
MRSIEGKHSREVAGRSIWTIVGWLAFAVPLGLYLVLQLMFGSTFGV